jgi:zinc protease
MKHFTRILLLFSYFAGGVRAQEHLPSNLFMTKLDNGLQVLVIEDNSVPIATIEIAVHNGSYTEDSAFNGYVAPVRTYVFQGKQRHTEPGSLPESGYTS